MRTLRSSKLLKPPVPDLDATFLDTLLQAAGTSAATPFFIEHLAKTGGDGPFASASELGAAVASYKEKVRGRPVMSCHVIVLLMIPSSLTH